MNFAEAAKKTTEFTLTENGAFAYNTAAQGALLDMFSVAGALRSRSEEEIIAKLKGAEALLFMCSNTTDEIENQQYAYKLLGDIIAECVEALENE